jgi:hypothetical protein
MSDVDLKYLRPGNIVFMPSEYSARLFAARYLWPKTKFADTNSIDDQLAHIISEIDEAAEASDLVGAWPSFLKDLSPAALHFFRELADAQASISTLWYILDRLFGEGFSEKMIIAWVIEKNLARGYYGERITAADIKALVGGESICSGGGELTFSPTHNVLLASSVGIGLNALIAYLEGVEYRAVLPGGPRGDEEEHF